MNVPLLSFFTGGGFLDLGFELAGFEIVWTNEVQPSLAEMYEAGISSWRASRNDPKANDTSITERRSIADLDAGKVIKGAFSSIKPDFWGLIGGPPCQDFSAPGINAGVDGHRGYLTKVFIDLVCDLQPSFFIMENVPGLVRQEKHKPFFRSIIKQLNKGNEGYIVDYKILNALEFGVPQDRERVILVGFQKPIVSDNRNARSLLGGKSWFPWPEPIFPGAKKLPWPTTSPFRSAVSEPHGIPIQLTVNALLEDGVEALPNGQDIFQAHSGKFWQIDEGDVSGKSFKRLHRYRYSPTAWYGNNEVHLHPWKARRLSVREALRIQTVPDEYVLPDKHSLTDKFRIITNGVPCTLANCIAQSVMDFAYTIREDLENTMGSVAVCNKSV